MSCTPSAENTIERVRVSLGGARDYEIVIGADLLSRAGALIQPVLTRSRLFVVSDETVAGLHWPKMAAALEAANIKSTLITIPPGEKTKSFAELEKLLEALIAQQVERGDVIAAFGGGVVGDLVGFAAAILRRGVDFVQIPTTLLAQVDSSVGGKTAINSRHAKNLIGAFHQPRLVLCDLALLDSLPSRDQRAGYAEIVKYGLLGDAAFFQWLEKNGDAVLQGDRHAQRYAVAQSCRQKAAIVSRDEKERGDRALLNLGHTFGHAFEHYVHFDPARLRHGEAVAFGMALAFAFSARQQLCTPADSARVAAHLQGVGLPVTLQDIGLNRVEMDALLTAMGQDKKVQDGQWTLILARGIGEAFVSRNYGETEVSAFFRETFYRSQLA